MIDFFTRGGPLMYPLLLCSVIGWAIFMERLFAFIKVRRHLKPLYRTVKSYIQDDDLTKAIDLCAEVKSPLARILLVVVKNHGSKRSYLKSLAEEIGEREAVSLQRYLGLLGTIANISPLLGLLGTVLGMIKAFNVMATQGMGTPATLGGGISEALITTAAGLTVAVPMLLLHRYLSGRSEGLILELEEATMKIVDLVEE
ncbi:biopolymer transport protein ExbB [Desulfuromusa kysingii]|uniref:Biopolymer transport protein ExbB n=1 Tax=Desulfuromusa kysingii TaxID=37625 RepID=A0A1H4BF32_9BACT|nr:MotA/TolQ/ExbB proton channel family protein [Desulfuromusa kysingii]SEA46706.1 biopolymer transport protein ExbB [Desulfuromusa kysingii]